MRTYGIFASAPLAAISLVTNITVKDGQPQEETIEEVCGTKNEEDRIAIFEPMVTLNVGGQLFTTTVATPSVWG